VETPSRSFLIVTSIFISNWFIFIYSVLLVHDWFSTKELNENIVHNILTSIFMNTE